MIQEYVDEGHMLSHWTVGYKWVHTHKSTKPIISIQECIIIIIVTVAIYT